jgi:hypothetical protein
VVEPPARVLQRRDGARGDLGVDGVGEARGQAALDGRGARELAQVVRQGLLGRQERRLAEVVELRAARAAWAAKG